MSGDVADRVAALVGHSVERMVPIDRGHIANKRYVAHLSDGRSVFVKEPTNAFTEAVLADERRAYESLGGRPFLPGYVGSTEQLLVVEDLSHAYWPPPWRAGDLDATRQLLDEIASVAGPATLRDLNDDNRHHVWSRVAAEPEAFLSLGVCDRAWFESAADVLLATDACALGGAALVHGDFRSDNLCILEGRAVAVDWGAAARGRGDYDLGTFAITLAVEQSVVPDEIAPDADPSLVGVLAGTFAYAAALPAIPEAIRDQLFGFLQVALPWCARLLALPPPGR